MNEPMKYLVTGGAGYIGSFMVKKLLDENHEVVVVDSLERGDKSVVPSEALFIQGNLADKNLITKVLEDHVFDGVFHFAAYISVAESSEHPGMYFFNNLFSTLNLLEAMREKGIYALVFSSTAAVYGNPQQIPIPESHQKSPESPYGESKLMVEQALKWYYKSHHIRSAALRYFNACGAALDGSMGEKHNPETHIIPNAIKAAITGSEFNLFGDDYPTKDGTCVRDYIHVLDLADSHILAMKRLHDQDGFLQMNVGTGNGYSNKEIVTEVEKVSGKKINIKINPRRAGDPSELVADPTQINKILGFVPTYSDLSTIISSAWKWHTR